MNSMAETPISHGKAPSIWRTLLEGVRLGLVDILVTSCLFAVILVAQDMLANPYPLVRFENRSGDLLGLAGGLLLTSGGALLLVTGFTVIMFLVAIFPCAAGRGLIALALQGLAHRGQLTRAASLLVGLLGAGGSGLAVAVIWYVMPPMESHVTNYVPIPFLIVTVAIYTLAGLLYSEMLRSWLSKRMG